MRICVSGGDVVGLLAAYLCRRRGHTVVLVEREPQLGRAAYSSGFKFLERSPEVIELLDALGVVYEEYTLATGLLERGEVKACPRRVAEAIHAAHWRKTHLTAMPAGAAGRMTDPEVTSKRYAVSLDWRDLARRLAHGVAPHWSPTGRIFDQIFETRPLWESRLMRPGFARDEAMAVSLHLLPVRASKDRYLRWDVVYTPHTPGNAICRFYHSEPVERLLDERDGRETRSVGHRYVCEYSGERSQLDIASDLNFLFPDGWCVDGAIETTHGKLVALPDAPQWPAHVCPLGRMAQWDETVSLSRVIRTVAERVPYADA